MKYIKGLDTLRAMAVFFVIISHWGPSLNSHTIPGMLMSTFMLSGQFGVDLFFVLSGFLITSILLNERFENSTGGAGQRFTAVKNFFIRRTFRIFPIYYLTIFILFIIGDTYLREHFFYFLFYAGNILLYKTNQPNPLIHLWSLAVEEQFYILWPWLILFLKEKHLKYVFILAIIIGIVSKYYVAYVLHHTYQVLVFNCFDAFGIGGLYAWFRLGHAKCAKFERQFRIIFPFLLFIDWRIAPFAGNPFGVIYTKTLDSVISLALIMFVLNNRSVWMKKYILENRVFNFLGKISYGLYLYHYILGNYYDGYIINLAKNNPALPGFISSFYFSFCIKITLLLIICWLSFKFIEQPILRLKKKFEYPKPPIIA